MLWTLTAVNSAGGDKSITPTPATKDGATLTIPFAQMAVGDVLTVGFAATSSVTDADVAITITACVADI